MSLLLTGAGASGGGSAAFPVAGAVPSAWFKADDGASNTAWLDKAGTPHNLSGTATVVAASQNGLPGVQFNGTSDVMASAAWTVGTVTNWFVVCKYAAPFTVGDAVTDGLTGFQLLSRRSSTDMGVVSSGLLPTVPTTPQAAHVYRCVFAASTYGLTVDGGTSGSAGGATAEAGGVTVGSTRGAFFAPVILYEIVLVPGTMTAPNIAAVEAYLKAKWGTP